MSPLSLAAAVAPSTTCTASYIQYPSLTGAEILSLTANPVSNYSLPADDEGIVSTTSNHIINFCNVTITYTHPSQNDTINVNIWLPETSNWNGRFMGTGGSGWSTGEGSYLLGYAVLNGYSGASTDGGHPLFSASSEPWAFASPGNINLYNLQNFMSVALNDMTILGKAVTENVYSSPPEYSYWTGCSTGGRQGLMMAQRYPTGYNGIIAAAPAINWDQFVVADYWPQFTMNQLGEYPSPCEFEGITAAAIASCDGLDGVMDGVVSATNLCHFNASSVVGQTTNCTNGTTIISSAAATIANAAWAGMKSSDGGFLWYGLSHNSPLTGLANTTCDSNNSNCVPAPFPISTEWIEYFIQKDPAFDPSNITHKDLDNIFHASSNLYSSIAGTSDPDLSEFRDAGGKMITWHGLADQYIFSNGSVDYYERVQERDEDVRDYYRLFEAPGVQHCGFAGAVPLDTLSVLVQWVENGTAPDKLYAMTMDGVSERYLCPYPLVSAYLGGDVNNASSFECRDGF